MKSAYTYLAWLIALDVLLQAASIAYASFGLGKWVDDGHTLTKGTVDDAHFAGVGGYAFHGVNGTVVITLLGIALLVVAFLAGIPGAPKAAGILLAMIVVQVLLGMLSQAAPILGAVHGMLALGVFGWAAMIGMRVMLADKRSTTSAA